MRKETAALGRTRLIHAFGGGMIIALITRVGAVLLGGGEEGEGAVRESIFSDA
ncbi:MAG: hypothetical protein ACTFAK_01235 [Candidatus Electronema sp. VV]